MSDDILRLDAVQDYADWLGGETLHPLATVIDFGRLPPHPHCRKRLGFYALMLKDTRTCGALRYGLSTYDYREGTLLCLAPNQVVGDPDDGRLYTAKGFALLFHPDLLRGTPAARAVRACDFFGYASNEALHMSKPERAAVLSCFRAIRDELRRGADRHTRVIAAAHIEALLGLCARFYDRQFATRQPTNRDLLARFEAFLDDWFASGRSRDEGLPTVAACAKALSLSPNYFGDLVRKETGITAQEHIHRAILAKAKEALAASDDSVSEIAYRLGFKYPQHLGRLFRRAEGVTPAAYRRQA